MAHTELDLRERRAVEDMPNAKVPVSKIAGRPGYDDQPVRVSHETIYTHV
ncbi:hypothetical protein [Cognatiyoonia sp. IB215182]|nr:hypothetical protein [Cognatiyoonia sp. IB215182]MDX8355272.1 hypothetical protein [Cognatiyoonia sp. IB215182]